MKIIFAGTPKFALPALIALLESKNHKVCAVYTQPDRPAGRGLKIKTSPIKEAALTLGLPVYQPASFMDTQTQNELCSFNADVLIDVACGLLLPKEILELPRYGCINIHPSLLPRWRGASPIQSAILAGDTTTGVTIMQMDESLDGGVILKQASIKILETDTSATLEALLADLGAKLLLLVLEELSIGTLQKKTQDDDQSTYAPKITKETARINWQKTAAEIGCMIRAFNPWPIAYTQIGNQTVRIFKAQPINNPAESVLPGTIIESNKHEIDVVCGSGALRLLEIQLPGGRVLPVSEVLKAKKTLFKAGNIFC